MTETANVLVVDDEANMRVVLSALVRRAGHHPIEAPDGVKALEQLREHRVSAVLSDLKMPHMNGLELLDEVQRLGLGIPVILLTAHGTIGSAVDALKRGAFDYLTKPFDPAEVGQVLEKAVRTVKLEELESRVSPGENPQDLLVGESCALERVKQLIERVADTPATVLIGGESGTGKELVAKSLHLQSSRRDQPFVKINCAAIPEGLLESELFGHERGAFTGAARRKPGRFELANGGTLFLDEIGEMPLSSQPKLLNAIQEGRFYRVGGTYAVDVDVRLIAATNRDLAREVEAGRFREDLFYRLNVVPIELPSLRERREDIEALAQLFVTRLSSKLSRPLGGIDSAAMRALRAHGWPGNIRELENAIERAVLLADGPLITPADLPDNLNDTTPIPSADAPLRDRTRSATRQFERRAIVDALRQTEGNVTRAAERLGLSRRGLQLKMRELEIDRG